MGPNGPGKARAAAQPAKARTATWGVAVAAVFALIVLLNLTHFMRSNAHVSGAVRLNDGGQAAGEEQLDPKAALSRAWRAGAARLHAPQLQGFGADRARAAHDVHGAPVVSSEQEVTSVDYIRRFALTAPELDRKADRDYWLARPASQNKTLADVRMKVREYLLSADFEFRVEALKAQEGNERGIVISTGGPYYLPQAIVLLRVLRHTLNSSLPVELYWHGPNEMDDDSLDALKEEFGPLEGYDVKQLPYPEHHLQGAKLVGFPMKPYALLHSKFKQVLLLDCDIILARDPAYMFETPEFKKYGNIFWSDIYSEGMVRLDAYEYVGVNSSIWETMSRGKGDFRRYAESGQIMIDRTRHLDALEWVWFLNSFGDKHLYEFMYGDKDTYGIGFGMAGKGHMYQQLNIPPAGIFTNVANLGWRPPGPQMVKQGGWWLNAFAHYDPQGEVLLVHRVTGEVGLGRPTPRDEVITPPMPISWSMWWMGYAPTNKTQHPLEVMPFNVSQLLANAPPGQACPMLAWTAYWTMRTHGVPTERRPRLEDRCSGALRAQYGDEGAALIRSSGLMERPLRLVVNKLWDQRVNGGWNEPRGPMLAFPLNMTSAYRIWQSMDSALNWTNSWHVPMLNKKKGRRLHSSWRPWGRRR